MLRYTIRRFLLMIPTLFGVAVLVFLLLRAMPGYELGEGRERYVSNWARAWRTLPVRRG